MEISAKFLHPLTLGMLELGLERIYKRLPKSLDRVGIEIS